jgi:hypothetical protein
MLERDIERYLYKKITEIGGLCLKIQSPTTRGMPDRIIIRYGSQIFVETKSSAGKTRLYQRYMHNKLKKHGVLVYIVNSRKDVDVICSILLSQNIRYKLSDSRSTTDT